MPTPAYPRTTVAVIDLASSSHLSPAATQIDLAVREFHGLSLLEWCARRLSETTTVDEIVITGLPSYVSEIKSSSLCNAKWMPSLQNDPFSRLHEIAQRTRAQWIVMVNPTCPFLDPSLLDRLITSAWQRPEADFVGFFAANHPRLDLSCLGLVGEVCTRQALDRAFDKKLSRGEEVSRLIRSHPNVFQMRLIPLPEPLDRSDLRFIVETHSDWESASGFYEAAGDDLTWQRLVELADSDATR